MEYKYIFEVKADLSQLVDGTVIGELSQLTKDFGLDSMMVPVTTAEITIEEKLKKNQINEAANILEKAFRKELESVRVKFQGVQKID